MPDRCGRGPIRLEDWKHLQRFQQCWEEDAAFHEACGVPADQWCRHLRSQQEPRDFHLVRRFHRDLESRPNACATSHTCATPHTSDTSAYASAGTASVLLRLLHRQLCHDRVVRWERERVLRLWWKLVRISSPSSHTGSHTSSANAASSHTGSHASSANAASSPAGYHHTGA